MVNPTVPGRKSVENLGNPVTYHRVRDGNRQAPPYNLVLPYYGAEGRTISSQGYTHPANTYGYNVDKIPPSVTERAYSKWLDKARSSADIGAAVAEASSACDMIAKRALQLRTFAGHLRRFDFPRAARELGLSRPPKGVSRKHQFASNYLEFHFGWSPLVGDVFNAVDVLQSPLKPATPLGRAGHQYESIDPPSDVDIGPWGSRVVTRGRGTVRVSATVKVRNENLWLANQLGLVNPASVLWEIVPFSFVVDWFVNVGDFLSRPTDLAGLDVDYVSTTHFTTSNTLSSWGWAYGWQSFIEYMSIRRVAGFPASPQLGFKVYKPDNWRRALAQVSLLTLALK